MITIFSSIDQYIILFFLYVFLFKDTIFKLYCSVINTELIANTTITDIWMNFLHKAHYMLVLRNTKRHFSITFGEYFKQPNHQQKAQKWKKWNPRPQKEHFLLHETWNKKTESRLVQPQLGTYTLGNTKFSLCVCLQVTTKLPQVLILGLQITFREKVNLQT